MLSSGDTSITRHLRNLKSTGIVMCERLQGPWGFILCMRLVLAARDLVGAAVALITRGGVTGSSTSGDFTFSGNFVHSCQLDFLLPFIIFVMTLNVLGAAHKSLSLFGLCVYI